MPLTDPERDFVDHYTLEGAYFQLGISTAHRQFRERQLDDSVMLYFAAIRQEEWQAAGLPYVTLDFLMNPKLPDHPVFYPWPDNQSKRQRLLEATRLCEENALLSRDFRCYEGGEFTNLAPQPRTLPGGLFPTGL